MPDNNPNEIGKIKITNTEKKLKYKPYKLLTSIIHFIWGSVDDAVINFMERFEFEDNDIGKEAFRLVHTSLIRACFHQIQERQPKDGTKLKFSIEVYRKLSTEDWEIDRTIFLAPDRSELILEFVRIYEDWVRDNFPNYSDGSIGLMIENIRFQYAYEIYFELWRNRDLYHNITELLNNNKLIANNFFLAKRRNYYSHIKSLYSQTILGDPKLTLDQMYIEPMFKVHIRNWARKNKPNENFTAKSIHQYITTYFLKRKRKFGLKAETKRFLLLLGQPGQGKTSFCYRLIHDCWSQYLAGWELVFVKLRDIEYVDEFVKDPFGEIIKHSKKRKDLKFRLKKSILILDGLDEIYMTQGLEDKDIRELFERLIKELEHNEDLFIIVTSRYHYANPYNLPEDEILYLELSPMNLNQQLSWLKKYHKVHPKCKLKGSVLKEIDKNKDNKYKEIKELISQPILLSLIVNANFDLSLRSNRSKIYEKLFDTLINRSWSEKGQLKFLKKIDKRDFREFMGTIALKIYQSDHEYITSSELRNLQETKEFIEANLSKEKDSDKALDQALKQVLISFYFQEVDGDRLIYKHLQKQEYSIEFLHKSLQEYLAAEKIYYYLKDEFTDKKRKGYVINSWREALKVVWNLVQSKPISREVASYLAEIVQNDFEKDKNKINVFRSRLQFFFPILLERQFLYRFQVDENSGNPFLGACTTFFVYWHILSYLGYSLPNDFSKKIKFSQLIVLNQIINGQELNLKRSNLEKINLSGAYFHKANLEGSVLRMSVFEGTRFEEANLNGADLSGTYLNGAEFRKANLEKANLERAELRGAYFNEANLKGTNFKYTRSTGAFFPEAHMEMANLKEANLRGAFLYLANLEGASLESASLEGAYLEGANMKKANLEGANLDGALLYSANLEGAFLEGAKNYTIDQLVEVKTLFNCKGLNQRVQKKLLEKNPRLFKKPKSDEEE